MKSVYQFNLFESNEADSALNIFYYSNLKKAYLKYREIVHIAEQAPVSYSHIANIIANDKRYFSNFSFLASVSITKLTIL